MTKTPIYAPDVSLIQLGYALVLPMTICLAKHEFTLKAPTSYLYTAYAPVVLPFSHQPPSSLPLDNFFGLHHQTCDPRNPIAAITTAVSSDLYAINPPFPNHGSSQSIQGQISSG